MSVRRLHTLCGPSQRPSHHYRVSLVPHSTQLLRPLQATTHLIPVITNELACFRSHISGIIQKIFICVWFLELAAEPLRFIMLPICSVFQGVFLSLWICHNLFIHSCVDGYLGYLQFGAIMKKTHKHSCTSLLEHTLIVVLECLDHMVGLTF